MLTCGDGLGAEGVRREVAKVGREERVHLAGCDGGAHGLLDLDDSDDKEGADEEREREKEEG